MQIIPDYRPLHRRCVDVASALLAGVGDADLARATPCAGWDLRTLLAHMVGQNHGFAEAVEAGDAPAEAYRHRAITGADLLPRWRESGDRLVSALAAAPLDRAVILVEFAAGNPFPVRAVVGFQLLDTVIHTWDVASALGRPFRPDDELLAATLGQAEQVPQAPAVRQRPGAAFAPVLPLDGGDDWDRALALLGRRG